MVIDLARLTAVALVLAVAACQPPVHPFAPKTKLGALQHLIMPGPRTILVVPAVSGAAGDTGAKLAERVAAALQDYEIGATTRESDQPRYRLFGSIISDKHADGYAILALRWVVADPNGRRVAALEQTEALRSREWNLGDTKALTRIAERIAPRIDETLRRRSGRSVRREPIAETAVPAVLGAPGDGADSLAAAMRKALARRNVRVVNINDTQAYQVQGQVLVQPQPGNRELITITWTITHPGGKHMGVVSQRNTVVRGSLDGPWGRVAQAVAENGADGLVRILQTVRGLGDSGPGP